MNLSKRLTPIGLASMMAIAALLVGLPSPNAAYAQPRDEARGYWKASDSSGIDVGYTSRDPDVRFDDRTTDKKIYRWNPSDRADLQAQESPRRRLQQQVTRLYEQMLERSPSLRTLNEYAEALERGWSIERVREDIANSYEAERAIDEVYFDVLDRRSDRSGLRTYQSALARGWSLSKVRQDIAESSEAQGAINRLYREVLGRNADRDGLRTYQRALARGRSLRDIRRDLQNSDEARRRQRR